MKFFGNNYHLILPDIQSRKDKGEIMFADRAKIYIRSGKGGDGHCSFRRELYVPNGGPDGGDGGRGGDLIFAIDEGLNTLVDYRHKRKYAAGDGEPGGKRRCHGKDGKDLILYVPEGTVIKEAVTGKVIADMSGDNRRQIVLKGGKGGLGNQHFATSTMQVPKYAQPGQPARELEVKLELKVIADVGLIGFPNVGKSTLFNSLTKAGALAANYPFATIDPNVGVVTVPDERLKKLAELYQSKKVTPAVIEFVDIAGLVKGASKGEGLGNQFLANIRECDAIVHVVRCFEDTNIVHVDGNIDPLRDIETINLELLFSDMEILERRYAKTSKAARMDKSLQKEAAMQERLKAHMEAGNSARTFELLDEDEEAFFKEYGLLTAKPVIYAANVSEDEVANDGADNAGVAAVREFAATEGSEVFVICAEIEQEIAELDDDEKAMFLEELGMKESGLDKLIKASYSLLGLISYLTSGEDETRAWTITKGTKAPQAAGKIHTDFERGFIKAEVVNYQDLLDCGSTAAAKEKGLVRVEGKEYVVQDGDIMHFRFNV